jgi:membrane protease YdiL (CAAX protease family)
MINKEKLLILFFAAFVLLAELMLKIDSRITFLLYFVVIVFFLFALSKTMSLSREGELASIFLIIPIVRVIQLFLNIDFFWNNLILYTCFLYLAIVCVTRFDLKEGFTTYKGHFVIYGLLIGIILGLFSSELLLVEKKGSLLYLLPLIVFAEEIFFRGVLQTFIEEKYGRIIGMVFVSVIYGFLCLNQGNLFALLFFVFYLAGSILYTETRNLFATVGLSLMFHLFFLVWT